VLFSLQVLDSLLAQYGTVENVEQGKDFKIVFSVWLVDISSSAMLYSI